MLLCIRKGFSHFYCNAMNNGRIRKHGKMLEIFIWLGILWRIFQGNIYFLCFLNVLIWDPTSPCQISQFSKHFKVLKLSQKTHQVGHKTIISHYYKINTINTWKNFPIFFLKKIFFKWLKSPLEKHVVEYRKKKSMVEKLLWKIFQIPLFYSYLKWIFLGDFSFYELYN
jgi:hypothetical protein